MKTNETTTENQTQQSPEVGCCAVLASLNGLAKTWKFKAKELDKMKEGLSQTAENVDTHKRLSIKAGTYRALTHELERVIREFS